jgi:hypothetical protein
MKAFEITLNGTRQCTAGVEDGVLTAILSFVRRTTDETKQAAASESLDIRVGGLANIGPGISEQVEWLYHTLSVGDEVTIKILELQECDEPSTRETHYVQCSFCGKKQEEVQKLIAGPGCYICDLCVNDALKTASEGEPTGAITILVAKQADARCSFCGQLPKDVVRIVGVPTARICNQCLKICNEILVRDTDCEDLSE